MNSLLRFLRFAILVASCSTLSLSTGLANDLIDIQSPQRNTPEMGYLIGSTRDILGKEIRKKVILDPFTGQTDRAIYIEARHLSQLSEKRKKQIRAAAESGQMIALIAHRAADIREFRKILSVTDDVAYSPGLLFAVRKNDSDYAEFTAIRSKKNEHTAILHVGALLKWKNTKLAGSVRVPKDSSVELLSIAQTYNTTQSIADSVGYLGVSVTWFTTPCYSQQADKYFIYCERDLSYTINTQVSVFNLVNAYNFTWQSGYSLYGVSSNPAGWVQTATLNALLLSPIDSGEYAVFNELPASNGAPTTAYTYNYSYSIGGAVSYLGSNGASVTASAGASYDKNIQVSISGNAQIEQLNSTAAPNQPVWYFTANSPAYNLASFPTLNNTTSWVWAVNNIWNTNSRPQVEIDWTVSGSAVAELLFLNVLDTIVGQSYNYNYTFGTSNVVVNLPAPTQNQ